MSAATRRRAAQGANDAKRAHAPLRVELVHMPWGALERPALGISLLQAGLLQRGHDCRIQYLNMRLADSIGPELYGWINHDLPHIAFAGEWLFTAALYGADAGRDEHFIDEVLRAEWHVPEHQVQALLGVRARIEDFMQAAFAAVDWQAAQVVGFTSTFEQNIASLALARRIKAAHPQVCIAFGGANWEGPMGLAYQREFDFVDLVCTGEADISFPLALQAWAGTAAGRAARLRKVPGISFRDAAELVSTGLGEPIEDMDSLPLPRFDDYFAARDGSVAAQAVAPVLLFESSRGCWWGAKSHCTFCGLNGHSMGYRAKSGAKLLAELQELVTRWPCPSIEAVDNILDMRYFDSVLPVLEGMALSGPVFYEIKANLKRHHVAALQRAHIMRIQPGIESMSDHVLQLMRKGTTALRNVQLLKWCAEYGIHADWNLLYGFPGETDADYEQTMELLPKLSHIQLAGACGPIRLDRFSPYFEHAADFGLRNVRPLEVFKWLYPQPGMALDQAAYYFQFDYGANNPPSTVALQAAALAHQMREDRHPGRLQAMPRLDGGMNLADGRPVAQVPVLRLDAMERCIVERIDEMVSAEQVVRALEQRFAPARFAAAQVEAFLNHLVALNMALSDGGGHYLGLALMPQTLRPALEATSRRREPAARKTIAISAGPRQAHAPELAHA